MSTRYNTGNPIESTDVRDMSDNAKNFDEFSNSNADAFTDRFGVERKTIHGMNSEFDGQILNMGYSRIGTFSAGATLINARQTLLWDIADGGDGQEYGWSGAFPKFIPPLSNPNTTGGIATGAWISRFDPELRIAVRESLRRTYAESGYAMVGGSFEMGGTVSSESDVLLYEYSGEGYSYAGPYPHTVNPGETPASAGWTNRSAELLRNSLSSTVDVGLVPMFADTAGVPTLNIPDNPAKRLFINKVCSSPDDFSAVQIARHAKYSGGTAGYVGTAVQAKTYVEPTATSTSEWTALFQIDNYAPNNPSGGGPGSGALPQNVAIYGQAQKRNTGSTWSLCTEINDYSASGNGAAIGHELACSANGPDDATNPQRNSSHVAIGKLVAGAMDLEWGRGYWVSTSVGARVRYAFDNTAAIGDSAFHNKGNASLANSSLMRDEGSLAEGINLSAATYSSGVAMRLATGQKVAFDPTAAVNISGSAAGLLLKGNANILDKLAFSSSKTQSTATAGATATLPAKPAFFLQILIDGSPFVIPVYGA